MTKEIGITHWVGLVAEEVDFRESLVEKMQAIRLVPTSREYLHAQSNSNQEHTYDIAFCTNDKLHGYQNG